MLSVDSYEFFTFKEYWFAFYRNFSIRAANETAFINYLQQKSMFVIILQEGFLLFTFFMIVPDCKLNVMSY